MTAFWIVSPESDLVPGTVVKYPRSVMCTFHIPSLAARIVVTRTKVSFAHGGPAFSRRGRLVAVVARSGQADRRRRWDGRAADAPPRTFPKTGRGGVTDLLQHRLYTQMSALG